MKNISEYESIKVGGVNLNNLRYADDTALMADSQQKLQDILDFFDTKFKRYVSQITTPNKASNTIIIFVNI